MAGGYKQAAGVLNVHKVDGGNCACGAGGHPSDIWAVTPYRDTMSRFLS